MSKKVKKDEFKVTGDQFEKGSGSGPGSRDSDKESSTVSHDLSLCVGSRGSAMKTLSIFEKDTDSGSKRLVTNSAKEQSRVSKSSNTQCRIFPGPGSRTYGHNDDKKLHVSRDLSSNENQCVGLRGPGSYSSEHHAYEEKFSDALSWTENRRIGLGGSGLERKPCRSTFSSSKANLGPDSDEETEAEYFVPCGSSLPSADEEILKQEKKEVKINKVDYIDKMYPDLEEKRTEFKKAMIKIAGKKKSKSHKIVICSAGVHTQTIYLNIQKFQSSKQLIEFFHDTFGSSIAVTYTMSEYGGHNALDTAMSDEAWSSFNPLVICIVKV